MVKTKRKASNSSTPRRGVKKKIQTIPKKKQVTKILRPNGYKEYRLVLPLTGLDGTMVKHQGPRLCSPGHVKLYFSPHNRTLLGVWTHNAHLLPPNYSACVTGFTNKNIAHSLTFKMVRSQVSSMISTIAAHAAAIHFKASLGATDSLISTSEKIDQVSPSIELSDELFQDFPLSEKKNLEEFDITWGTWDISMESL